jgi:hypothetical protein
VGFANVGVPGSTGCRDYVGGPSSTSRADYIGVLELDPLS